jgi:hypothetical protein
MLKTFPFLLLLLVYVAFLPLYVQGGDTAELVAAAFHGLLAHPPGYPLYLWLQKLWLNVLPVSSVFWRASLLNAILAILALYFLCRPLLSRYIWFVLPLLMLGLKSEFIEASVLPDVFSLHALFVALIGYHFFLSEKDHRQYWVAFLFWFSFANHHTSVLLFPCYLFSLWETRHQRERLLCFIVFSLSGLIGSGLLYLSLFLLDTGHPLSWGNISSLSELFAHIIRADYGTFKLASGQGSFGGKAFFFFLSSVWPQLLAAGVIFYFSLLPDRSLLSDKKFLAWTGCLVLTLLFPLALNVNPNFMGEEILRRFHVMPLIVLTAWCIYLLRKIEAKKEVILYVYLAFIPATLINLTGIRHFLNLRNDSTIEDYARNLYREAQNKAPAMVVLENDTAYFALRYLQAFEKGPASGKVVVVTMPLFFHPWYLKKVQLTFPEFQLEDAPSIYRERRMNQDRQLIRPNLENISFIFTSKYREGDQYEITFLTLGRMLRPGSGVLFSPVERIINFTPSVEDRGPQHFTKLRLFYEYSHWFLPQALHAMDNEEKEKAISLWKENQRVVPYAFPAMANLCAYQEYLEFCKDLQYWEKATLGFY